MNKVKILTDSCADMDKELRDKYDVDYLKMTILWGAEEKPASCDWDYYTPKELYDAMRGGLRITTQQVSQTEFETVFNKYLDDGYDIVYIACSSALSSSYSTGCRIANEIMEKREGAKIFCVDPKNSCLGEALVVMDAAKYYKETGASAEEVAKYALERSRFSLQFVTVGSLTYLKNAGRVKASSAFFGNLFGIKPIIISDAAGANVAVKKIKGRRNALDECVNMLYEAMQFDGQRYPISEQTVQVVHADCIDDANYLAERVMQVIKPKDVAISYVGPIIGASAGPDTVGVYGFGRPVDAEG